MITVKVFTSYSRRDAGDIARQIYDSLKEDHDIFTDVNSIQVGSVWNKTIENNISNCDLFLIIVTPATLSSKEIEREVLQAQRENKTIIPCIHRDVQYTTIKWDLTKIQGLEFDDKYELVRKLSTRINQSHKKIDKNNTEEQCRSPSSKIKDDFSNKSRVNSKNIIFAILISLVFSAILHLSFGTYYLSRLDSNSTIILIFIPVVYLALAGWISKSQLRNQIPYGISLATSLLSASIYIITTIGRDTTFREANILLYMSSLIITVISAMAIFLMNKTSK